MSLTGAIRESTNGDINVTATQATVHCWTKRNSGGGVMVNRWGTPTNTKQFRLQITGAGVAEASAEDATERVCTGVTVVTTGVWHPVGLRYDGASVDLLSVWLDGVKDNEVAADGTLQSVGNVSGSQFRIGFASTGGSAYDGLIADVAIWLAMLTDGEMQALAKGASPLRVRPKDLYHYWPLYDDFVLNDFANPAYALVATGLGGSGDPAHAPVGSPFPVTAA